VGGKFQGGQLESRVTGRATLSLEYVALTATCDFEYRSGAKSINMLSTQTEGSEPSDWGTTLTQSLVMSGETVRLGRGHEKYGAPSEM
jgi:hypothetical protein